MVTRRNVWIKIFKIAGLLFCLGIVMAIAFTFQTLSMLPPIGIVRGLDRDLVLSHGSTNVTLEKESFVNYQEVKSFFLLGQNDQGFDKWFDEKKTDGSFKPQDKKSILLNQDVVLNGLKHNDCDLIYCYQQRIPFQEMPGVLWRGLMGVEDSRFLDHSGVDPKSIARAIVTDIKTLSLAQGGSTITQQLAKNLFFTNEKKLIRKLRELVVAVYLEYRFEKEEILESYFNEVEWGSLQGIRVKGIKSASYFYFAKNVDELEPYESAILISLLKGPAFYHPIRHTERLKDRVGVVFKRLVELDLFPGNAELIWDETKWEKWVMSLKENEKSKDFYWLWMSLSDKSKAINQYEKFIFIKKAQHVLSVAKEKNPDKDLAVKAIIKSLRVSEGEESETFFYYSKYERNKQAALSKEKHQVGSTLKPLLYLFYLQEGKTLEDLVTTKAPNLKLKSGSWSPREAGKVEETDVTLAEALQRSLNAPVINLANEIGFDKIEGRLGEIVPSLLRPLKEYPAQLLGSLELSLEELLNIYSFFIREDCRYTSEHGTQGVLEVMSDPKLTTVKRRVGRVLQEMNFFGKTGTSNSGHDNWFVFFDGVNLGAIWLGLEGPREGVSLNLYGSSTSFEIFQSYVLDRGRRFPEFYCLEEIIK